MHKPLDQHLIATGHYIRGLQLPSGAVPWFEGGITDPWDHVEALMGMSVAGHYEAVRNGFAWLASTQRPDGAWFAAYQDAVVADDTRAETNFVAYPATGLWHYFLITGDTQTLAEYWPMIQRAMAFVLELQSHEGEIFWAMDTRKGVSEDALVTGCSSIYKSLHAAAAIATRLGEPADRYLQAADRLSDAIRNKPHRFDRTWDSKARYSMDWFYPVLTGVLRDHEATARIDGRWHEFVEAGLGCRCVADEPWVTVAESCELVMACCNSGHQEQARAVYDNIRQFQLHDGSWWTGYAFRDGVYWPDEKPAWTAAAVLLAADALFEHTPGHQIFKLSHPHWG